MTVAQVAIWVLLGHAREADPTNDAAVNAEVAALLTEARAQTATLRTMALSASVPAAGRLATPLTITGPAGATVGLRIAAGAGALSATEVVLDGGGTATVQLTAAAPGDVVVEAQTEGIALRLTRFRPEDSQASAMASEGPMNLPIRVTFPAESGPPGVGEGEGEDEGAPGTPADPAPPGGPNAPAGPGVPLTPVTPGAPRTEGGTGGPATAPRPVVRPTLRATVTGPRRARGLQRVTYVIRVRNTGRVAARNVVVTNPLPTGLARLASPRGTLRARTVTFRLGTVPARAQRTVRIVMRGPATTRGARTNRITVWATNMRVVRAAATTRFTPRTPAATRPSGRR